MVQVFTSIMAPSPTNFVYSLVLNLALLVSSTSALPPHPAESQPASTIPTSSTTPTLLPRQYSPKDKECFDGLQTCRDITVQLAAEWEDLDNQKTHLNHFTTFLTDAVGIQAQQHCGKRKELIDAYYEHTHEKRAALRRSSSSSSHGVASSTTVPVPTAANDTFAPEHTPYNSTEIETCAKLRHCQEHVTARRREIAMLQKVIDDKERTNTQTIDSMVLCSYMASPVHGTPDTPSTPNGHIERRGTINWRSLIGMIEGWTQECETQRQALTSIEKRMTAAKESSENYMSRLHLSVPDKKSPLKSRQLELETNHFKSSPDLLPRGDDDEKGQKKLDDAWKLHGQCQTKVTEIHERIRTEFDRIHVLQENAQMNLHAMKHKRTLIAETLFAEEVKIPSRLEDTISHIPDEMSTVTSASNSTEEDSPLRLTRRGDETRQYQDMLTKCGTMATFWKNKYRDGYHELINGYVEINKLGWERAESVQHQASKWLEQDKTKLSSPGTVSVKTTTISAVCNTPQPTTITITSTATMPANPPVQNVQQTVTVMNTAKKDNGAAISQQTAVVSAVEINNDAAKTIAELEAQFSKAQAQLSKATAAASSPPAIVTVTQQLSKAIATSAPAATVTVTQQAPENMSATTLNTKERVTWDPTMLTAPVAGPITEGPQPSQTVSVPAGFRSSEIARLLASINALSAASA